MILQFISVNLIRFYQKHLSKKNCKYIPSCSEYTLEAILKHGFFVGVLLGTWRILRCNSLNKALNKGGFDPVPDNPNKKRWLI